MILRSQGHQRSFKVSLVFLFLNLGLVVPAFGFWMKSCRISYGTAICTGAHLQEVPRDISSTVTGVDLSKNNIAAIRAADFTDLPNVTKLDLSQNNMREIEKGAFSHLSSLEILNLNSNKLATLEEEVFAGLSRLTELSVTSNSIKHVTSTVFQPTTSLRLLDLSRNKLSGVPAIMQHLPRLQELWLTENSLTAFQSWELSNGSLGLRYLSLSKNCLKVFNLSTDVFLNLTGLDLGGSPGQRVKIEMHNRTFLRSLTRLDISSLSAAHDDVKRFLGGLHSSLTSLKMNRMKMNLTQLINIACSIPTLARLQFQSNNLYFIPSHLFRLCVNIVQLDISKNKVRSISADAFESLRNLRILDLSDSKLLSVPVATRNLPRLQELQLSHSNIASLQCDDFANNTDLRKLGLDWNSIKHLKRCLFQDLQQLSILKLQNNEIGNLNGTFQTPLPRLRTLQLNGNKIRSISTEEFKGLPSLQRLFLHNNTLGKLKNDSFVGLSNLTELNLQTNKLEVRHIANGQFNALVNLQSLNLIENRIQFKDTRPMPLPPFSQLSGLLELSIRGQKKRGQSYLPQNFLQGLTSLLSFSCRNMRLLGLHKDTFTFTPQLEHLEVNSNSLSSLSPGLLTPVGNLKSLYITSNNLRSLDFLVDANLTKLEFLQARKNQYSVFRAEVLQSLPALRYIDLQGNSFRCDCDNEWFIHWVENNTQTQVFDAYNFKCNYPSTLEGRRLLDIDIQSCLLDVGFVCFVATACATLCLMAVPSVYHFMRWQLVYTYYLFLAWLADTKHKNREAPHRYDAFVSYNGHDERWVIEQLLPKLEAEQGWRLCLHHRDFQPGKSIVDNITEAIYGSRKTICVISRRYLESEWCSREIQAASFRLFDERKDVLILVFLEDIPASRLSPFHRMRKLLKRQTYLSWTRAGEHRDLFWEKLRQALQAGQDLEGDRFHLVALDRK